MQTGSSITYICHQSLALKCSQGTILSEMKSVGTHLRADRCSTTHIRLKSFTVSRRYWRPGKEMRSERYVEATKKIIDRIKLCAHQHNMKD